MKLVLVHAMEFDFMFIKMKFKREKKECVMKFMKQGQ